MDDSNDGFWASWWPRAQATGRFEALGVAGGGRRPGVLVDGGWLRLLGVGSDHLPSSAALAAVRPPGALVIGVDLLGGVFALDRGSVRSADDEVCYWAPDALEWVRLGLDHGGFLTWLLGEDLEEFYAASRWEGWRRQTAALPPAEGVLVDPPLWSQDADDIDECTITCAPFEQVIAAAEHGVAEAGGDRYPFTVAQWQAALSRGSSS